MIEPERRDTRDDLSMALGRLQIALKSQPHIDAWHEMRRDAKYWDE